jgi:hypothetical protein
MNSLYKIYTSILLGLILAALVALIQTVNDKGINMHLYQKISTDHVTLDVDTGKGTTINMKSCVDIPEGN